MLCTTISGPSSHGLPQNLLPVSLGPCAPAGAYAPAQNAYLRGYNNAITCKQPDLQLLEQGLPTGDKARNGEIVPLLALRPHGLHPASHALPSRLLVT
jgi:hypothetical protein